MASHNLECAFPVDEMHAFRCPITQELMDDPVFTSDGHTYERAAIEHWLQTHNTSPVTNDVLPNTSLTPNHGLRNAIEEWRQRQPMAMDPDCLELTEEVLGNGSFSLVRGGDADISRPSSEGGCENASWTHTE